MLAYSRLFYLKWSSHYIAQRLEVEWQWKDRYNKNVSPFRTSILEPHCSLHVVDPIFLGNLTEESVKIQALINLNRRIKKDVPSLTDDASCM